MKKTLSLLLAAILSFAFLTGCGNTLFDDFEQFLNVEMTEVNENYDKIKAEVGNWENIDEDAALEASLNDVLLPLVNDSLEKVETINPETEEVKSLKSKYVRVMEAYKEGFGDILDGVRTLDEEKMLSGSEKIEEAVTLLDEYNTALEALAAEVGAEIEY